MGILCSRKWVEFYFIEFWVYSTKFDMKSCFVLSPVYFSRYTSLFTSTLLQFIFGDSQLTVQLFGHAMLSLLFAETTLNMERDPTLCHIFPHFYSPCGYLPLAPLSCCLPGRAFHAPESKDKCPLSFSRASSAVQICISFVNIINTKSSTSL